MPEEFRELCRIRNIGKKISEETKRKLSEMNKGENAYWFGKHHTNETKKKISYAKSGNRNHNYGKHFSDEHKSKIGKANSKKVIQLDTNTNEIIKIWNSIKLASDNLNICRTTIIKCCKKQCKTAGGFKWEYFNN